MPAKRDKQLNNLFLYNRRFFERTQAFANHNWSGFIWCMEKCFPLQDTQFWWCLRNNILYNIIIVGMFIAMIANFLE